MSRPVSEVLSHLGEVPDSIADLPLSTAANAFVTDLYHVLQAWDDFYDGDQMTQAAKLEAIWASLVGIPTNPFFRAHSGELLPLMASLVVKWESANQLEAKRERLDIAFVWRAAFFDVVLHCLLIEHGPCIAMEQGPRVARLYSETFDSFRKEFEHA